MVGLKEKLVFMRFSIHFDAVLLDFRSILRRISSDLMVQLGAFQFSSFLASASILQRRKIVGQARSSTRPGFRSLVPGRPPLVAGLRLELGSTCQPVALRPRGFKSHSRRQQTQPYEGMLRGGFRGPCRSWKKNAFSDSRGSTSRDQIARIFSRFFFSCEIGMEMR
jgi:hypothetical protein